MHHTTWLECPPSENELPHAICSLASGRPCGLGKVLQHVRARVKVGIANPVVPAQVVLDELDAHASAAVLPHLIAKAAIGKGLHGRARARIPTGPTLHVGGRVGEAKLLAAVPRHHQVEIAVHVQHIDQSLGETEILVALQEAALIAGQQLGGARNHADRGENVRSVARERRREHGAVGKPGRPQAFRIDVEFRLHVVDNGQRKRLVVHNGWLEAASARVPRRAERARGRARVDEQELGGFAQLRKARLVVKRLAVVIQSVECQQQRKRRRARGVRRGNVHAKRAGALGRGTEKT